MRDRSAFRVILHARKDVGEVGKRVDTTPGTPRWLPGLIATAYVLVVRLLGFVDTGADAAIHGVFRGREVQGLVFQRLFPAAARHDPPISGFSVTFATLATG